MGLYAGATPAPTPGRLQMQEGKNGPCFGFTVRCKGCRSSFLLEVESEIVERFLQCDENLCRVSRASNVRNMHVTDKSWAPENVT